jgi:hypothetical protein
MNANKNVSNYLFDCMFSKNHAKKVMKCQKIIQILQEILQKLKYNK